MWDLRCRLMRVVDGDTLTLFVDRGRHDFSEEDHRLFGTYAPERSESGGPETTDFTRRWLEAHDDGSPWPFIVETMRNRADTSERRSFDRYLSMIYTRDRRHCLNLAVTEFVREHGYSPGDT